MVIRKFIRHLIVESLQTKRIFDSETPWSGFRNVRQFKPKKDLRDSYFYKPQGLWYSCGTAWRDWLEAENWQPADYQYAYEIIIDPSHMLIIDSEKALDKFNQKYSFKRDYGDLINWHKVAKDYAGIEICPYQWSYRYVNWYYPWDVASGCIWNEKAIKQVVQIK